MVFHLASGNTSSNLRRARDCKETTPLPSKTLQLFIGLELSFPPDGEGGPRRWAMAVH
jgi:hypothetical protein